MSILRLVELAKEEFSAHSFPHQAFYQHHASFDDLERSANSGCDICALIIDSFKDSGPFNGLVWPETSLRRECDISTSVYPSVYSKAKSLMVSDVKVCINTEHLYLGQGIEDVLVFDTLLVQVGAIEDSESDLVESEVDYPLPPLSLTLSVSNGTISDALTFMLPFL